MVLVWLLFATIGGTFAIDAAVAPPALDDETAIVHPDTGLPTDPTSPDIPPLLPCEIAEGSAVDSDTDSNWGYVLPNNISASLLLLGRGTACPIRLRAVRSLPPLHFSLRC